MFQKDDGFISFWQILKVVKKWWWLIGLIATIITAATALILFRTDPTYKATAVLEIKQKERRIVDVSDVDNVIADKEFLTTQIELLKSETLAEDIVQTLNLMSDKDFYTPPADGTNTLSREERLRLVVNGFSSRLHVASVGRSRLIKASFDHSNPKRAALIVNTLIEKFINNSLDRKFNATAEARDFLEERLALVKTSLEDAERKLVQYASDNQIIIINNTSDAQETTGSLDSAALVTLDAELTAARTNRIEKEQTFKQAIDGAFVSNFQDSKTLATLKEQRVKLNSEYLEKKSLFKPDYPEMVELRSRIDFIDQEIAAEKSNILSLLKSDFELAKVRENGLQSRVNRLKTSVIQVREKSIEYNILKRQVDTERTQYDALLQRLKEVSVSDEVGSTLVQIVDPANPPQQPFKPNKPRLMVVALLLSGLLGFGIAYLLEIIDDRIKTPDDIKDKLHHIVMAVIPAIKNIDSNAADLGDPQSGISEAYASLRTNLQYSGPDGGPKVIQLTSTRSGEGKSVSALALAIRFAGLNVPVLLIDADLRRPTFLPGHGGSIGLSGLMTQNVPFAENIQKTRYDNLSLIPSGPSVPNPSEILSGPRFEELLHYARENYRYIIVDSPPVLGLADALILGAKVDASLLVVEARRLRTVNIQATIERLRLSGTKVLGVVLTKYKAPSNGYSDYYQYNYGKKSAGYSSVKTTKKTAENKSKIKFEMN